MTLLQSAALGVGVTSALRVLMPVLAHIPSKRDGLYRAGHAFLAGLCAFAVAVLS